MISQLIPHFRAFGFCVQLKIIGCFKLKKLCRKHVQLNVNDLQVITLLKLMLCWLLVDIQTVTMASNFFVPLKWPMAGSVPFPRGIWKHVDISKYFVTENILQVLQFHNKVFVVALKLYWSDGIMIKSSRSFKFVLPQKRQKTVVIVVVTFS